MKIIELLNSIQLHLNNEEADLLAKFDVEPTIKKSKFDPRETQIANQLVIKGALIRKQHNGKTEYRKQL